MTAPLVLRGAPALSAARLAKQLARVQRGNPGITAIAAEHVHLVQLSRALTDDERALLDRLLTYGPRRAPAAVDGASLVTLLVVPRLGTISSWSSKATDIAHTSGLDAVRRVERGVRWTVAGTVVDPAALHGALADRMTESVLAGDGDVSALFAAGAPRPLGRVALGADPIAALAAADRALGLALAPDEIEYLARAYAELGRDPTDVELMMFAQANSEHCRHKIFNATFLVDGAPQERSLFQMIRESTAASPDGVLSAYSDNACVFAGPDGQRFFPDGDRVYRPHAEPVHILLKVETHNHPTAIAPFPGAATGSGGEIRDEGATGMGAKPKAGVVGFTVSNLRLPGAVQPWERPESRPGRIASALDIMIDGPLGGAAFNNEFGRPAIGGYFRTFELDVPGPRGTETRGFHKPVMIAGGVGNIRAEHVQKGDVPVGAPLVVLGGPALLIGLGGGAASSMAQGASHEDLDFASVQRDNAEIQRRCQEVIDACWAMGANNPIVSVHDVGAGGLSNALPELAHGSHRGATFDLRAIPAGDPAMSPAELWCNEAQERYVIALAPGREADFGAICARERAPWALLGHATEPQQLRVEDPLLGAPAVDMPMDVLLGKPPRMVRDAKTEPTRFAPLDLTGVTVESALERVLRLPTVADKGFLVTIGDRSVGGLVVRDPMVGPWQVPCADVAVTATDYVSMTGEAMAMGERPPVALLSAGAASRLAIAEAITNIAAAPIARLSDVRLSCNWMAAAGWPGEDARLYEAVRAAGSELAVALGIAIPVGKDSMSMKTVWKDDAGAHAVVSPITLVVTAAAPVTDVSKVLTPQVDFDRARQDSVELVCVDLSAGKRRLGGSCLAQVHGQLGDTAPDLDDPALLRDFFAAVQELRPYLVGYHDRSDGGLLIALLEMAFASGAALDIRAPDGADPLAVFFNEEPGAVLAVLPEHLGHVMTRLGRLGLGDAVWNVASARPGERIQMVGGGVRHLLLDRSRHDLRALWSDTTHRIAQLRDDAACADEEQAARLDPANPGLTAALTFDPEQRVAAPYIIGSSRGARPAVAILREQGCNSHVEMASAFTVAGFEAVDVHMTDLHGGLALDRFRGLVAVGGFSYGDVLGAGEGWAKSLLYGKAARETLTRFLARTDTFTLGVCNGCQMMSALRELVPGAERWPRFVRNRSEQFEARLSLVEITPSPSLFFAGMAGSRIPIPVAHGEGRVEPRADDDLDALERDGLVSARFVDGHGHVATTYPANPNGSPRGITALTVPSGRVTILMPHPERATRAYLPTWRPRAWATSPWQRIWDNARAWVG
ncbi:MAG TPA: phosphoribosylformylglycinamidine synthase [Kofleriaceae bacterium]|nr:phosphoribosylformylglycinamidine synthase [Kofleriaceae bacterium]